jgi:hypothetical protein
MQTLSSYSGHPFRKVCFSLIVLASSFVFACGGSDQERPDGIGFGGGNGNQFPDEGPCEDGTAETCSATIYQANGVKSCFRGVRFCTDGEWSACSEPPDEASE